MSGVWALVPVKCFGRGKSRLAGVMGPASRARFTRALLRHVLSVLAQCGELAGTVVVTDCSAVEAVARHHGAAVLRDDCIGSLGAIVDGALARLASRGARAAIVLMSDLPLLTPSEVHAMVHALQAADVVLAPDLRDMGTNALGVAPPDRFPSCFGRADSFQRHVDVARQRGDLVTVRRSHGLAFDVDAPSDYVALRGARLSWKRKRPSRASRVRAA